MFFPGIFQIGTPVATNGANKNTEIQDLKYNINVLNVSFDTLVLILIAAGLNLYYVYKLRADACDTLNNTNFAKGLPDESKIPEFVNFLFLYSTSVFFLVNYDDYRNKVNVPCNKRNQVEITKAYNGVVSSLLVYIASVISRRNFDINSAVNMQQGNLMSIGGGIVPT